MYIELKGKFFRVYKNKDGSMFMMKKGKRQDVKDVSACVARKPSKSARKSMRKSVAKKSMRKSARKSMRKSARKSMRKSARKSMRKSAKKSARKCECGRSVCSCKSSRKSARKVGRPRKYAMDGGCGAKM